MQREIRLILVLQTILAAGLFPAGSAAQDSDQRDNQRTRHAQAVSREVYETLENTQEFIDQENYRSALATLEKLYASERLTGYERANVLNYLGVVHYSLGNTSEAITTFREMLVIPELEPAMRKRTLYTLAQLQMADEQYAAAKISLGEWFSLESNPSAEPYISLAHIEYGLGMHANMIAPVETAIRIATERNLTVKEDWYILLNFAYFQQENFDKVRDIQKILLANWPKKSYWFTLAGAYTELGNEQNVLVAYDLANTQGLLTEESQLLTMVQLYLQHDLPYQAGTLLERHMEAGDISRDAKTYRLLSQAWSMAQEVERSVPALVEAARLGNEGELDLRLANAFLNLGRYADCERAVRSAIGKGGIRSPDNALISLGMCLYHQQKYGEAIEAFSQASQTPRSERMGQQWTRVIKAEIARNEQIQHAEAASARQLESLARRRGANSLN